VRLRNSIALLISSLAGCLAVTTTQPATKPAQTKARATRHPARRHPAQSWRTGQMHPDPERYKQLQQALAEKGYLNQQPTGVWDQQSTDALRRFQKDQNLEPSGKLDARTIIALGLGPKYPAPAQKPSPAQQP
jgi:peptidoglycan hydrolase-like protein with peptidoglycan-binding domain